MRKIPSNFIYLHGGNYHSYNYNLQIVYTFPIEKTTRAMVIFKEQKTNELWACTIDNNQIKNLDYRRANLFINSSETPKGIFVKEYIKKKFNLKLLSKPNRTILKEHAMNKINFNNTHVHGEKLKDIIINKVQSDDFPEYEESFAKFVYDLFVASDATEILDSYHYDIELKFTLLRKDNRFTGTRKIYTDKFTDNKNHKTFDSFNIELSMLSDYDENLKYLKKNIKEIKNLLKFIVENDYNTKDFSNYLKLYSLVLNRENTLIARFCFKDGLESLCK